MRISDWSSDVCSSDLIRRSREFPEHTARGMPRSSKFHPRRPAPRTRLPPMLPPPGGNINHYAKFVPNISDRKSVVEGESGSTRVDLGGRRSTTKKKLQNIKKRGNIEKTNKYKI